MALTKVRAFIWLLLIESVRHEEEVADLVSCGFDRFEFGDLIEVERRSGRGDPILYPREELGGR